MKNKKVGVILNNLHINRDRDYLWDIVEETVDHYKDNGALHVATYGACHLDSASFPSNADAMFFAPLGSQEVYHNYPKLTMQGIDKCLEAGCKKILITSVYYKINKFDFLDDKICFLREKYEYSNDIIFREEFDPSFIYGNSSIIKKAWEKRSWNYDIKNPSKNIFQNFLNIASTAQMYSQFEFYSKPELELVEVVPYWRGNIRYIKH